MTVYNSEPPRKATRFCSYCGTKLDEGARFCKNCGEPIVQLQQPTNNTSSHENPKEEAKEGEYVFQELETLDTDDEQIEQFIIYRWNRVYPTDVSVEIGTEWKLTETEEFPGFSHEKITKEIYCRE